MAAISADDKLIWNLITGQLLTCIKSVVMEDSRNVAFTIGRIYSVDTVFPLADPPVVGLMNDQGEEHKMTGEDIRQFFSY